MYVAKNFFNVPANYYLKIIVKPPESSKKNHVSKF